MRSDVEHIKRDLAAMRSDAEQLRTGFRRLEVFITVMGTQIAKQSAWSLVTLLLIKNFRGVVRL